jgi:hypothetical protein
MTLSKITFNRNKGGLGRPLPGEDHYSGLIFYNDDLPDGFEDDDRIKQIFSVEEAEALGILDTYPDEAQSDANYLVTAIGANGDKLELKVTVPNIGVVSLGIYTKTSAETTTALVATAIRAVINAGTLTHGYTAGGTSSDVSITAPKGTGIKLNSGTPLSTVITGTIAGTLTQFSGGEGSLISVYHYHISEFFRINPQGVLWVGIFDVPVSYDFAEVATMQNYADGAIRQIGVYVSDTAFATSQVNALQVQADILEGLDTPLNIVFGAEISGTALLSSLPSLGTLADKNVSVSIAQDGGSKGYDLFLQLGKSIGCVGSILGAVSIAKVSESIAWVDKFNMVDGEELDVLAFANGTAYKSVSAAQKEVLDNQSYCFLLKHMGQNGSFWNYAYTAIIQTSDYCTVENNRTIDKAVRQIRIQLLPRFNSPLEVNADGTLSEDVMNDFEVLAGRPLEQMQANAELSAFAVSVNPAQNVLSTSELVISVSLVPIGVAKSIKVNIGFTVNV